MKKLLLILLCLPMIGFASFPIATDTKKCERIIVSLYYHVDQKIDNERSNTEIINSPLEKDGFLILALQLLDFWLPIR